MEYHLMLGNVCNQWVEKNSFHHKFYWLHYAPGSAHMECVLLDFTQEETYVLFFHKYTSSFVDKSWIKWEKFWHLYHKRL